VLLLLTEEARLKLQYRLVADQLKEVRNKKDELLLKMKKRAACSAQCPHKVELEQLSLRKELADLKSSIERRPKINRVRPINLIEINDNDTDVEPNTN
jgi:hypothetical protein